MVSFAVCPYYLSLFIGFIWTASFHRVRPTQLVKATELLTTGHIALRVCSSLLLIPPKHHTDRHGSWATKALNTACNNPNHDSTGWQALCDIAVASRIMFGPVNILALRLPNQTGKHGRPWQASFQSFRESTNHMTTCLKIEPPPKRSTCSCHAHQFRKSCCYKFCFYSCWVDQHFGGGEDHVPLIRHIQGKPASNQAAPVLQVRPPRAVRGAGAGAMLTPANGREQGE